MSNMIVIIKKQLKDTLKNKTILIQFILFPFMTVLMENAVKIDGMPTFFFTKLFAVMYIGMAPLTATASVIAEEKEKNTLRVLTMADIRPWQYLCGIGIHIWMICMLGACVMSTTLPAEKIPFFLLIMGTGFIISVIAGASIGIFSKNQMMATSIVMPFMMILSFAPMLSLFNDRIKKFATVVYTQQLMVLFDEMTFRGFYANGITILLVNALLCVLLFAFAYRRKGLA
ncbi:MAG: ABC transporter permease [Lachnospiraceae bacterium]|nr:ABC transporter permease [Lachnospiraceae bacterium]